MIRKLIIEYNVITGKIDFKNEDEMSFIEILGTLEYLKWMIQKDWDEGGN